MRIVVVASLGAAVGVQASRFSGAYLTERAEWRRKLLRTNKAMLSDISNSIH